MQYFHGRFFMSELNNCFKEAVCVDVQRVFDSCSDRDCIYELPITLSDDSPSITSDMDIVRTRCAEVDVSCISVNSVPFKTGYYAVDITYRFRITAEAFSQGFCKATSGTVLCGYAYWNKRVILYGSEGNAKVFTSEQDLAPASDTACTEASLCCCGSSDSSMPKATVHVIDPIALDTKFICVPNHHHGKCDDPCAREKPDRPEGEGGAFRPGPNPPAFTRKLAVSLGLFSIVQLSRPVSMIIPAYDYCIPCKDCSGTDTSESPCDVFDRMEFPSEQFFPQPESETSLSSTVSATSSSSCGCSHKSESEKGETRKS
jgi:hypothetical protein